MNFKSPSCTRIANKNEISNEATQELRKKSIGGSDAGAVLGLSPYDTPLSKYCEKLDIAQRD